VLFSINDFVVNNVAYTVTFDSWTSTSTYDASSGQLFVNDATGALQAADAMVNLFNNSAEFPNGIDPYTGPPSGTDSFYVTVGAGSDVDGDIYGPGLTWEDHGGCTIGSTYSTAQQVNGCYKTNTYATFTPVAAPEPSSLITIFTGLALLSGGVVVRRRKLLRG
jgi:hypothetical protein